MRDGLVPFGHYDDKPFSYFCHYGTEFFADSCNFQGGVTFRKMEGVTEIQFMNDVSEMIGYHATNIWPDLNGFNGYDNIEFTMID